MKKLDVSFFIAFVILVMTSVSANANLVSNPGFESYGANSYFGIHSPTDWTVTDSSGFTGSFVPGQYFAVPTLVNTPR